MAGDARIDPAQILFIIIFVTVLGVIALVIRRAINRVRRDAQRLALRERLLNKVPGEMRWRVFERDGYTCQRCGTRADLLVDFVDEPSEEMPTRLQSLTTRCVRCAVVVRESGIME